MAEDEKASRTTGEREMGNGISGWRKYIAEVDNLYFMRDNAIKLLLERTIHQLPSGSTDYMGQAGAVCLAPFRPRLFDPARLLLRQETAPASNSNWGWSVDWNLDGLNCTDCTFASTCLATLPLTRRIEAADRQGPRGQQQRHFDRQHGPNRVGRTALGIEHPLSSCMITPATKVRSAWNLLYIITSSPSQTHQHTHRASVCLSVGRSGSGNTKVALSFRCSGPCEL